MVECFDPEIVFYTQHGEYRGRQEVVRYLSERYFKFAPKLRYDARPRDVHTFGDALWYSYDFWIDAPEERLHRARDDHVPKGCRRPVAHPQRT